MKSIVAFMVFVLAACGGLVISSRDVQPSTKDSIPQVELAAQLIDYNVTIITDSKGPCCGGTITKYGGEYFIITASHCVVNQDGSRTDSGLFKDGQKIIRWELSDIDRFFDVALLRVTENYVPKTFATLASYNPAAGERVIVIGFGGGKEDILSTGIVSMYETESHTGHPVGVYDGTAWYGNSGGGVFNEAGELVGVIVQIGPQAPPLIGWTYFTRIMDIRNSLGV